MKRLAGLAAIGVGSAIVLLLLGVQAEFAWAWGAVAAAIAVVVVGQAAPDSAQDDAPHDEAPLQHKGSDVSRLGWAINLKAGTVGAIVTRRVVAILRRRLQHVGLDPDADEDAPEVEALLGPGLWARLNGPRTSPHDIEAALDAAERLQHGIRAPQPSVQEQHSRNEGNR